MRNKSKTVFLKYNAGSDFEDKLGGGRKNGRHGAPRWSISGIQGELSRADWHSKWREILDIQLDVESVGFGNGKKRIGFGKQNDETLKFKIEKIGIQINWGVNYYLGTYWV